MQMIKINKEIQKKNQQIIKENLETLKQIGKLMLKKH